MNDFLLSDYVDGLGHDWYFTDRCNRCGIHKVSPEAQDPCPTTRHATLAADDGWAPKPVVPEAVAE